MQSFNQGEHVIAAFIDVKKAFDNVWHNGLRYKIYQLDLPTKLCRWLSDFLVGRVIQVKIEGSLSPKVYPKAGVPQGSNLSPLLFLIYVNDMPNRTHQQTNKSQFADDGGQWAVSKNIDIAAVYLQRDLEKLARWCAKWRIKLNPEKTKVIIFSKSQSAIRAEPALSLYGDLLWGFCQGVYVQGVFVLELRLPPSGCRRIGTSILGHMGCAFCRVSLFSEISELG